MMNCQMLATSDERATMEQTRSSSPGTPLTNFFKPLTECEGEGRPTSSMQCSQGTLSTCPTARVSPIYNVRDISSSGSAAAVDSSAAVFKKFPYGSCGGVDEVAAAAAYINHGMETGAECIDDLSDSIKVAFNVGGKEYWCTVGTLRGGAGALFSEDEECFFKKLLKKPWARNLEYCRSGDGIVRCHIDRNGKCFPYILDYIRRGGITSTDDRGLLDMIAFEADFYGLHRLRTLAEARLQEIESREDKILSIGSRLGDVVSKLIAIEQRAMMPSQITTIHPGAHQSLAAPTLRISSSGMNNHPYDVTCQGPASLDARGRSSSAGSSASSWSAANRGWRNMDLPFGAPKTDLTMAGLYAAPSDRNVVLVEGDHSFTSSSHCVGERIAGGGGGWHPAAGEIQYSVDHINTPSASAERGRHSSAFESYDRMLLINDDTEDPCGGASPDVLCKFYSEDRKFATDEDF